MAPSIAKGKPGQYVLDISINAMRMRGGEQGQIIKADLETNRELRTEERKNAAAQSWKLRDMH